jgi:hypothetical protein
MSRKISEETARQASDSYFGVCPHCHKTDGYVNVGREHVFLCHEHKVKWSGGSNLFSDWRRQTEEEQRQILERLGVEAYTDVVPYLPDDPYDGGEGPTLTRMANSKEKP